MKLMRFAIASTWHSTGDSRLVVRLVPHRRERRARDRVDDGCDLSRPSGALHRTDDSYLFRWRRRSRRSGGQFLTGKSVDQLVKQVIELEEFRVVQGDGCHHADQGVERLA